MNDSYQFLDHESIDYKLIQFSHKLIQFYLQNKIVPINGERFLCFYDNEPWVCNLVRKTHRSLGQKVRNTDRFAIIDNAIWFVESQLRWSWKKKEVRCASNDSSYVHPSNGGRFEVYEKKSVYKIWDNVLQSWCAQVDKNISESMIYYILINYDLLNKDLRKELIASSNE
jgi:hypothetical protein